MQINKILSVVIPVFNKSNFTRTCLKDLSQLPEDHEIIVVDNGSVDDTQDIIKSYPNIINVKFANNQGFAKACNEGYNHSQAPNVLFLNNDIKVRSNFTNWTAALIANCPSSIVGPTMGQLDIKLNFLQEANKELPGNSYMSGWCIASSKENWKKLEIARLPNLIYDHLPVPQIFSEDFFVYFEDTDLSFRARKLGIPFKVVDIPVVHFGKQSSSQLNVHNLYTTARQIFVKKWSR